MCIYLYINRGSDRDINLKTAYDTERGGWPGGRWVWWGAVVMVRSPGSWSACCMSPAHTSCRLRREEEHDFKGAEQQPEQLW